MKTGEDRHSLLIENLLDAFVYHQIVTDENGNPVDYIFLDANPAFYEMTGLPRDKVIGKKITEIQPEITETNFDWIGTYGKVAFTGETIRFEQYSEITDRWYEITAYSDAPGYFAVGFRDITESKKADQMLRDQQARLEKTQEIAHVGSWELDLKANRLSWSDEIYRFFGLEPQEFAATYEAFLEAVHPEDRAAVHEAYSSSLQNGRDTYEIEHRVVRKHTGEVRYVHEKCEHVRDVSGTVIRSVGMVQDITERKQAEEALRESKENLSITLNSIGDAVIATDADGLITRMNAVAEKLCAWPCIEAKGRPLADVFHIINAQTRQPAQDIVKTVLETGKVVGLANHTALIARDGTEYQIADSAAPIKNHDGRIGGVVLVFSDVSEDYALRQQIRVSEEKYRSLVEQSLEMLYLHDLEGKLLEVNRTTIRQTGYSNDELMQMDVFDLHPDKSDREVIIRQWRSWSVGHPVNIEHEHQRKDGTVYPVEVTTGKVIIGEQEYILALVRDITDRKNAEQDLRRREQEFRALAENSPDVVARFDRNLCRLYVNPAVEKHVGIPREELLGRTHEALKVPAQQVRLWNSALLDVFQNGCEKELYYDFAIPAGHRYYHSRIVPEFAPDGTIETVLSITRDITTIKKMEAALHQERAKTRRLHQRSLPDDLPVLPGLALAAYYRPAQTLQGDYYNVIRRGNQLLIYLVDVDEAGEDGVMQSLYVCNKIEDCLSAHTDDAALSPARFLHYLTERYHQEKEPGTSPLCVFIAVFEMPQSGEHENSSIVTAGPSRVTLRYTSTGFCTPPLVISGSGEPGKLSMDNPYLAPHDGAGLPGDCEEYYFTIVPGSTFVFSTDGLFNQGPDHGSYEPRLREVLRRHAHLPPELINQAVDTDFAEFCSDSPLHNDLAFIVVQVPETEQRLHIQVESDFDLVSKAKEEVSSLLASQLRQQPNLLHFHELLVNAMEHGNKRDGGKTVSVDVAVTERYYKITITDQGEGFNWRGKINRELDLDGDSERGRGIIMTRMLTNYLGYNERGNRVTMINMIK